MQARKTVALLFGLLLAVGCTSQQRAGWTIGSTLAEYQGQVLRVRDGGSGAERLKTEAAYDATVRHYVDQTGQPDYLLVADRYQVQLIYIEDDQIVLFQRSIWNPKSQATVTDGIPDPLASLFTRSVFARRVSSPPAAAAASRSPRTTLPTPSSSWSTASGARHGSVSPPQRRSPTSAASRGTNGVGTGGVAHGRG